MLLELASAAARLGHQVIVAGPACPGVLCDAAETAGFTTVRIPGDSTAAYLRNLRAWNRRHRCGLLWCNGLRPALATAGSRNRVVHLHQAPAGRLKAVSTVARRGAIATVVPSRWMQGEVAGSLKLWNWCAPARPRTPHDAEPKTVGYLGRLTVDKGVPLLAAAIAGLRQDGHDVRLLVAGEARFVSDRDSQRVDQALGELGAAVSRTGWMNRESFFDSIDLAVFPSVAPESFGLVAAEAMAARCPFVVSDSGALPEVAGPEHPWVSRTGDVLHLAETISAALEADFRSTTQHSYHRWSEHFSPTAGTSRLGDLLQQLGVQEGDR